MKLRKKWIPVFLIIFLQVSVIVCWGMKKVNFDVDEYLTYGLANSQESPFLYVYEDVPYSGDQVFLDYLTPSEDHRFDYGTVWYNQGEDVHPPFYYAMIHTVCSFFPGEFSKWLGISVNLIFFVLSALLIVRIAEELTGDFFWALGALALYGFSAGIIGTALFIRMYMMVSFFVLAVLWLHLHYQNRKLDAGFCGGQFLLTAAGVLTHYYFMIWLFFTAAIFSLGLLAQKRWKELAMYGAAYLAAAAAVLAVFPRMLEHLFWRGRGQESVENLKNLADLPEKLSGYFQMMAVQLVGGRGILLILMLLGVVLLLQKAVRERRTFLQESLTSPGILMAGSCMGYFLIISKIAPYLTSRYMSPVYGIVPLLAVYILHHCLAKLCRKEGMLHAAALVLCLFMAGSSWRWGIENTFESTQEVLDLAAGYADHQALYLYDGCGWKVNCNRLELIQYESYRFVSLDGLEEYLAEHPDLDRTVLYVLDEFDQEAAIRRILDADPELKESRYLFQSYFASAYYLE